MLSMLLLWLGITGSVVYVPFSGGPLEPQTLDALRRLPGVLQVATEHDWLQFEIWPGEEVRFTDLDRTIKEHQPQAGLRKDRVSVSRHTILELNAGRCFFCAEQPLSQTLARMSEVERWSVVDYAPKGRLRLRIQPKALLHLEKLDPSAFEDVVFTARYDDVDRIDLYWPTGGIEWRPDEATARREATASRKPLMIFPTAGT